VIHPLPQRLIARGGGSSYSTEYKIKMDLEHAEYLYKTLKKSDPPTAKKFRQQVVPIYKKVLKNIPGLEHLDRTQGLYAFRQEDKDAGIEDVYNRALHLTNFSEPRYPCGKPKQLLNWDLDVDKLQRQWFGEEEGYATPGIVVIDDILSPQALSRIRQILLESTVFYQTKMPLRFGGYVGAYIDDGLHDRILLQLAFELHQKLPRIMKGHPLKYLWAYKYDSDYSGINIHADQAAVNVNLWLTPDSANLDPDSGGLVIFTAKPPANWNFEKYNTDTEFVVEQLLRPTGFANVTVPHRQNRAVMFDSALFHHTDRFKFKKGFENHRINLTILYGNMQMGQAKRSPAKDEL